MPKQQALKFIIALAIAIVPPQLFAKNKDNASQERIDAFKQLMVKKHQFNKRKLDRLFQHFRPNQQIIKKMNTPYESKPWETYRKHFINNTRIDQGVLFWNKNQADLNKASKKYHIPADIIVAILGVETLYGKHTGTFSIFNSLSTLAFYYPKRSRFFTKELENYLLLSKEEHFPILSRKGSYAGAMGLPQFMPSSARHYATTPANRSPNLYLNTDAIYSIANYLKRNGWQMGQGIAQPTTASKKTVNNYISKKATHFYSSQQLQHAGITAIQPTSKKAAIIELRNDPISPYWVVYPNFKAIMSYNPRVPYAMAVYQLSQAIKNKRREALS